MAKNMDWMRAVMEDVRAYCEEHDLAESEAAIRRAMRMVELEAANDDDGAKKVRKH